MEDLVAVCKAFADPTRLKLFKLVAEEEFCVCELVELLGISQPAVSQHLAKLKACGLVRERRAGLWTYYTGRRDRVEQVFAEFRAFLDTPLSSIPEMAAEHGRRRGLNRAEMCRPAEKGV